MFDWLRARDLNHSASESNICNRVRRVPRDVELPNEKLLIHQQADRTRTDRVRRSVSEQHRA
jgi:hypothetical protein